MAKESFEQAFEDRLRERENQLETRATAGLPVSSATRIGRTPPRITGLGLTATQGSVTLTWNESPIGDLGRYQVQVSTSPIMASPEEYDTSSPMFVYTVASPLVTYYFRVRAYTKSGQAGGYSEIQSSLPGTVVTTAIETGAVQEYVKFTKSSGFNTLSMNNGVVTGASTETYGPITFTTTDANTIVIPRYLFDITFSSNYDGGGGTDRNRLVTELLRRVAGAGSGDVTVASSTIDFNFIIPSNGVGAPVVITLPTFSGADVVGSQGSFEYRLKLTVSQVYTAGTLTISIAPSNLTIEAFVIRR